MSRQSFSNPRPTTCQARREMMPDIGIQLISVSWINWDNLKKTQGRIWVWKKLLAEIDSKTGTIVWISLERHLHFLLNKCFVGEIMKITWAKLMVMRPSIKVAPSKCLRSVFWSSFPSFITTISSWRESKMWNMLRHLASRSGHWMSSSRIAIHKLCRLLNDSKPPMISEDKMINH